MSEASPTSFLHRYGDLLPYNGNKMRCGSNFRVQYTLPLRLQAEMWPSLAISVQVQADQVRTAQFTGHSASMPYPSQAIQSDPSNEVIALLPMLGRGAYLCI